MSFNNRSSSRHSSSRHSSSSNRSPRPDDNSRHRSERLERSDEAKNWDETDHQAQTRQLQQDSLESSSRALGKLIHASEIAQSNLAKLATQTEQIRKVDKKLDEADHHVKISETKTSRLKALNGWFFLPAIGSKSAKKKQEALEKKSLNLQESEQIRENGILRSDSSKGAPMISSRGSSSGGRVGHIHSTPTGLERDSVEEGIDSNLNQISAGLGRLRMMGASMNQELDIQKQQLAKVQDRADENKDRIGRLNRQMNNLSR